MGLLDKLDVTQKKKWRSVDVVETGDMGEPHVLQQQMEIPTTSAKVETEVPVDEHRLVPLSEVVGVE